MLVENSTKHFLALFIGERLAGLLGVFLAIPITGMIVTWIKSHEQATETSALPVASAIGEPTQMTVPTESITSRGESIEPK